MVANAVGVFQRGQDFPVGFGWDAGRKPGGQGGRFGFGLMI